MEGTLTTRASRQHVRQFLEHPPVVRLLALGNSLARHQLYLLYCVSKEGFRPSKGVYSSTRCVPCSYGFCEISGKHYSQGSMSSSPNCEERPEKRITPWRSTRKTRGSPVTP